MSAPKLTPEQVKAAVEVFDRWRFTTPPTNPCARSGAANQETIAMSKHDQADLDRYIEAHRKAATDGGPPPYIPDEALRQAVALIMGRSGRNAVMAVAEEIRLDRLWRSTAPSFEAWQAARLDYLLRIAELPRIDWADAEPPLEPNA